MCARPADGFWHLQPITLYCNNWLICRPYVYITVHITDSYQMPIDPGLHVLHSRHCNGRCPRANTHLHGSPCKDRPRLFPRAHKRKASGGISGTNYSPKVSLKGCEKGPESILIYWPKRNRVSVYGSMCVCVFRLCLISVCLCLVRFLNGLGKWGEMLVISFPRSAIPKVRWQATWEARWEATYRKTTNKPNMKPGKKPHEKPHGQPAE